MNEELDKLGEREIETPVRSSTDKLNVSRALDLKGQAEVVKSARIPLGLVALIVIVFQAIGMLIFWFANTDVFLTRCIGLGMLTVLVAVVTAFIVALFKRPSVLWGVLPPERSLIRGTRLRIGQEIVTLKPRSPSEIPGKNEGVVDWNPKMKRYIGTVTQVRSIDRDSETARLQIDGGEHEWSFQWLYWR